MEKTDYPVEICGIGDAGQNLRMIAGNVLELGDNCGISRKVTERPLLDVGESLTSNVNLSRSLGAEYSRSGIGRLALQFQMGIRQNRGGSRWWRWLKLPAPQMTVNPFDEKAFKAATGVKPGGDDYTEIRIGNHAMEGGSLNIAVFKKDESVVRILRFDPPVDTTAWQAAWDAKEKKLHVLAKGRGTRYWVTAPDQMDFEKRMDVAETSVLETTDGRVERKE
jgi:hypothetical protein